MKFQAYVINLEHAAARWEHMRSQLEMLEIPYSRIGGIYGNRLTTPIKDYNEHRYQVLTGKKTNKGEIGCYLSHIKALKAFLESNQPYALILEDDITLPSHIATLLAEAVIHTNKWDMIRLTSSRTGKYMPFAQLPSGHKLAYNLKVLKNTGAYFVNQHAAQCCVQKMLPMCLPYDVALDREWDFGFKTACMVPMPVQLDKFPGQIPKAKRIHLYRATTFHMFHISTHLERIFHRRQTFRRTQRLLIKESTTHHSSGSHESERKI